MAPSVPPPHLVAEEVHLLPGERKNIFLGEFLPSQRAVKKREKTKSGDMRKRRRGNTISSEKKRDFYKRQSS